MIDTLKPIGEFLSSLTAKVLELIPAEFLNSPTTAKILTIMINVGIIWALLKFASSLSKVAKIVLIFLLGLLILSIISTFI